MEKLSVVIITFNEEQNIERCIQSVQSIADEVVVLDSFSTDRTQQICEKLGAKFYQHAFDGHIEQKNRAITYASNDLILSLDADEAPDDTLLQNIQKVKEHRTHDGYSFNRLNNYCGKWIRHCGWYPDRKLRLWDRKKGAWGGDNPHDKYMLHMGGTEKWIQGDLLHYSFHTIDQHDKQIAKFTDYSAKAAFAKGSKSNALKIIYKPIWKFMHSYFIKAGFLDGYYGWVISTKSAYAKYLKYTKLRNLQREAHGQS